jgi:hypothetical protein
MKAFYLNIVLLNKEEVVAKAVVEKSGLSKSSFFGRAAGNDYN